MVTGPLESWSSPQKNVVLIGDAAHSMVNHMAQGAATSMEDGAFLAKCIGSVAEGKLSMREAIGLYEQERMPKAYAKQQVSFINGEIWQVPDGPKQQARDAAMAPELEEKYVIRSPNLYGDPQTVLEVYGYDVEAHADAALARHFNNGKDKAHPDTKVLPAQQQRFMGWFLPGNDQRAKL